MQQPMPPSTDHFSWQKAVDRAPVGQQVGLYSTRLACVSLVGADAEAFLQGQISVDMRELQEPQGVGRASLATRLDIKGRVVAVFWVVSVAAGYQLVLPESMVETLLADLGKYIVFSKASLEALSTPVLAVSGADVLLGEVRLRGDGLMFGITPELALLVASEPSVQALWDELEAADDGELQGAYPRAFEQALLAAGLVLTEPATSGVWLPQELACDKLGAVSFSKGCYLGQEVVARLHFKGQAKRQLYRLELQADAAIELPELGATLTDATGKKLGQIASVVSTQAGAASSRQLACLVVLKQACDTRVLLGEQALKVVDCRPAFAI